MQLRTLFHGGGCFYFVRSTCAVYDWIRKLQPVGRTNILLTSWENSFLLYSVFHFEYVQRPRVRQQHNYHRVRKRTIMIRSVLRKECGPFQFGNWITKGHHENARWTPRLFSILFYSSIWSFPIICILFSIPFFVLFHFHLYFRHTVPNPTSERLKSLGYNIERTTAKAVFCSIAGIIVVVMLEPKSTFGF